MPWKKVETMEERARFIVEAARRSEPFSEICQRFGISRETGYKWVRRFQDRGSVEEFSRAPRNCPHKTSDAIIEKILLLREAYPYWGPKKLSQLLFDKYGICDPPAPSTIGAILKRHGFISESRKIRRKSAGRLRRYDLLSPQDTNDVWAIDYKGWFRLGDRSICYPLTITDMHSRYVLACKGYARQTLENTKSAMENVFCDYGLPQAIRVDNGTPFGSSGIGGFTQLSVWWIQLGIIVDFIEPGKPEQNGSHERMHKTLKLESTMPPQDSLSEQQKKFDSWRHRFNYERPHEALGQKTPSSIYRRSLRSFPRETPQFSYPPYFESRFVRSDGMFNWKGGQVFIGEAYGRNRIGLIQNYDGRWLVYAGDILIGGLISEEPKHVVPVRRLLG